jgi:hypothetical protein
MSGGSIGGWVGIDEAKVMRGRKEFKGMQGFARFLR